VVAYLLGARASVRDGAATVSREAAE